MSPGNLYRYFPSKEALIAGIAERDRAEVAQATSPASTGRPGSSRGWRRMAQHHFAERPDEQAGCAPRSWPRAAATRRSPASPASSRTSRPCLIDMLRRAAGRGEISAQVDLDAAATMLMVLADGMSWRRASDPSFNAEATLPADDAHGPCLLTHAASRPARQAGKKQEGSGR